MDRFVLHSDFKPMGDQPQAIEALTKGFEEGNQFETLVGVTGSGKTFTMANIIQNVQKPTLIISHNKTLAAQLYGEMKEFFPENAVEYFVSYYDYYQPEAYVPQSDTYIAKDSSINDEIDKLRHSATAALSERNDVIIVASVSCIYGLGAPVDYKNMVISLRPGMEKDRDDCIRKLIDIQYVRNDQDFKRGTFRVRGDVVEVYPSSSSGDAIRVEFFGDEVDRISEIDSLTGEVKGVLEHIAIFPNSHYVVPPEKMERAIKDIEKELEEQVAYFAKEKIATGVLLSWYLIAEIRLITNGTQFALDIATKALDIAQGPSINNYYFIALYNKLIGEIYMAKQDFESAKVYIEKSVFIAKQFNLEAVLVKCYILYAKLFQELALPKSTLRPNYIKQALKMFQLAKNISIVNDHAYLQKLIKDELSILTSFCKLNGIILKKNAK